MLIVMSAYFFGIGKFGRWFFPSSTPFWRSKTQLLVEYIGVVARIKIANKTSKTTILWAVSLLYYTKTLNKNVESNLKKKYPNKG